MKIWVHIFIILGAAALFCALTFALASSMSGQPSWYHEPAVFPLRVAIWVSGNPHNPSELAGNVAWVFECLLAGMIADIGVFFALRWNRAQTQK